MPIFPSKRKGLGAILEEDKPVDTLPFSTMRLSAAPVVPEFSLEHFIPAINGAPVILNQGATSSCVAHAFIAGIHIAETKVGLPFIPCSRLFAYFNARKEMGPGAVVDSGTYLRTCAAGLSDFGVPDEKHWPFSEFTLKVNKRPSFDAMRWAHPRAGGKFVKIYTTGAQRIDAIKTALFAGYAVAFGTAVRESFLVNNASDHIVADYSPTVGGHAMLIIGWKTDEQGVVWFRVLNSWGEAWRDHGLCWFHHSLIATPVASDFHVVYGWQRLQEAITAGATT